MTGYGRGEAVTSDRKVTVEIKAVNHRFCDVVSRLPRAYICFEDDVRRLIQAAVTRGRVEVYLTVEEVGRGNIAAKVDRELALAYYKALEELRDYLGMGESVRLESIMVQPGVLSLTEASVDIMGMWPLIEMAVNAAIDRFVAARQAEGKSLIEDIHKRLLRIESIGRSIEKEAPRVPVLYRERLSERLRETSDLIDPARLMGEIALLADRADITEEVVRLCSHIRRVEETVLIEEPIGRRLDFLFQEMFREVNTIGVKAQNIYISQLVVEAKCELEKMREQVRNLE